ncbi:MDR family MFS transporter [Henriciella aquimarina]|uniref:MDR family MFS transporter n=1 Tax=Henriciella aquimarina TaxID=545261 RepID=UPI000A03BDDC|nr:MDR family MFS transporter [Henriciella aquimarina]
MSDSTVSQAVPGEGDYPAPAQRTLITTGLILMTLMTTIDATIANTVLPQIRASLGASQDEILWVLTSFILARTVVMPAIGWLEQRFGRRFLLLFNLVAFTVASFLCGISTNIYEMVGFRLVQGASAALFMPMSQAILLDITPPEKHARAMSIWGMGAVLGPIMGPILGGVLTEHLSWRWVFFINVPLSVVGFLILSSTLSKHTEQVRERFDGFGYVTLIAALIALQLLLDRGPTKEWFASTEIWVYLAVLLLGLYLFFVHIFTTRRPIIHPSILADANFLIAALMVLCIGVLMFAGMAVLPTMMQNLLDYPVITAGMTQASRGVGSFISMFLVGWLVGRFDNRLIVLTGIALVAVSYYMMSGFSLQMSQDPIVVSGFFQGLGIGLIFIPLMTMAFATIPQALRTEAASFFGLIRNVGSSVGISIVGVLQIYNTRIVSDRLAAGLTPDDPTVRAMLPQTLDLHTARGQAIAEGMVGRQAAMVAYVDSFHLLFIISMVILPLLFFLRSTEAKNA